jgi:hypothetical protein
MSTDIPEAIPAPKGRNSRGAAVLIIAGAAALAVGAVLALKAGEGQVASIRVTKHSMLPESIMGSPDYYVTVGTRAGKTITTKGYEDTPIGNGLDFKLPQPLALEEVAHAELMDADVGGDDMRDRVDVSERISKGQDYQFELIGPAPARRTAGYAAMGTGGALVVLAAILWVRSHAF